MTDPVSDQIPSPGQREKCPECDGPKPWHDPMGDIPPCEQCNGTGFLRPVRPAPPAPVPSAPSGTSDEECERCDGSGCDLGMCEDCGEEFTDPCARHRSFGHVPSPGGGYTDGVDCSTCCTACHPAQPAPSSDEALMPHPPGWHGPYDCDESCATRAEERTDTTCRTVPGWRFEVSAEEGEPDGSSPYWVWSILDGPIDPDHVMLSGQATSDPTAILTAICAAHGDDAGRCESCPVWDGGDCGGCYHVPAPPSPVTGDGRPDTASDTARLLRRANECLHSAQVHWEVASTDPYIGHQIRTASRYLVAAYDGTEYQPIEFDQAAYDAWCEANDSAPLPAAPAVEVEPDPLAELRKLPEWQTLVAAAERWDTCERHEQRGAMGDTALAGVRLIAAADRKKD